jgi:preprotein translocase subunit SecE
MAKSAAVSAPASAGLTERFKSWPERIKSFYTDVRTEMKKVTTPTWKEVQSTTLVVVITVFLFAAYFWAIDAVIGKGIDSIFRYFRR